MVKTTINQININNAQQIVIPDFNEVNINSGSIDTLDSNTINTNDITSNNINVQTVNIRQILSINNIQLYESNISLIDDNKPLIIEPTNVIFKDPIISFGYGSNKDNKDRGFDFQYYDYDEINDYYIDKIGFIGFTGNKTFKLMYQIEDTTKLNQGFLGNLEINKIILNDISNLNFDLNINSDSDLNLNSDNDLNIYSDNVLNLNSNTDLNINSDNDLNIISNNDIIIKTLNTDNTISIGIPDSKTIINSNLEIIGTLNATDFSFFNSKINTYADKDLILNYDNAVKIIDIQKNTSNNTMTIFFNEERDNYLSGEYVFIDGINDNNFYGIHKITEPITNTSVSIPFDTSLTIPTFNIASIGKITKEENSDGAGFIIPSYDDNYKLKLNKIVFDYKLNDSSFFFNNNIKTDNSILLTSQNKILPNYNYNRIYIKNDNKLYYNNINNYEHNILDNDNETIIPLNVWSINNDISYTYHNIGINNSNPQYELDVNGDISANSVITPSDKRLKKDIKDIKEGMDIIDKLNPVEFKWIENNNKSYGLIAQEVEEIIPEMVNGKDIKKLNYNMLIPFLIKSIQELKSKIEELENKII